MPQKLLDVLMRRTCSHEFAWPRRASDGQYYQVCLRCGVEYKYDWATMHRTERVPQLATEGSADPLGTAGVSRKPSWLPRSRRLKFVTPLRYRAKNLETWHEGTIENLSQSGAFFHGAHPFPSNTLIEMVFEMPEEICGQKNSSVLCQGRIIRTRPAPDCPEVTESAASILGYQFLHPETD